MRLIDPTHPLAGRVVRAHHVYRRKYRLWLVVTLPDGGGASVLVEDTDLLPRAEPPEGMTVRGEPVGTVLSYLPLSPGDVLNDQTSRAGAWIRIA